jgi:integrase
LVKIQSAQVVNIGSAPTVQQILGHSDPKVTMRYAHLSTKALQEAANTASMIFNKPEQQAA